MTIVPKWEEYSESDGEIVVRMDPGMAFGTGTHETTRLVCGLIEKYLVPGQRVLDVGTRQRYFVYLRVKSSAPPECFACDIDPSRSGSRAKTPLTTAAKIYAARYPTCL